MLSAWYVKRGISAWLVWHMTESIREDDKYVAMKIDIVIVYFHEGYKVASHEYSNMFVESEKPPRRRSGNATRREETFLEH